MTEGRGCVSFETAFLRHFTAQPGDIDANGHVNNVVYLSWVQDVAIEHWRTITTAEMQQTHLWVALRHEIDYRDEVKLGETVEARTWVGEISGPRFARHVDIRKPGAARFSSRSITQWCLIDAASRRPKRIGPDVLEVLGLPTA